MLGKKKVLMINHEFPPIGGGGGTTTFFLAKHLVKLGLDIHIVTTKPEDISSKTYDEGFSVHYIGPVKKNHETSNIPEMTRFILLLLWNSEKLVNEIKPDLIHCFFSIPAGCVGLYIQKKFNIPFITSTLGADVPGFNIGDWKLDTYHNLTHNLSKAIWEQSSYIVANSESLKKLCNNFLPNKKIDVITNGVDTESFFPKKEYKKNDIINLLFVSRLSSQKGVLPLLKAVGELSKRGVNNFNLTIVGDGPLREKMFELINEYNLNKKIDFLGWRNLEELPQIYRNADIFILPSVMEGMPSVVLQAMASGLPVIGSKVDGFNELLQDGVNGYCVKYGDYETLSLKIESLLINPELRKRFSEKSLERVKNFSWETISKKYLDLYSSLF